MKSRAITIRAKTPPVVELDSESLAAYVRFSNQEVARTQPLVTQGCLVTVDYAANGEIIGIELVGVREFGVESLLQRAGIRPLSKQMAKLARYVPAKLQVS